MREIFTYGSVGGAPGNRCFYLEVGFGEKLAKPLMQRVHGDCVAVNRGADYVKHLVLAPCARTRHLTRCHGIACAFGTAIAAPLVSATISYHKY